MINTLIKDQFYKKLETLEYGRLTLKTPEGKVEVFEGRNSGEAADIEIRDWRVVSNMARKGDIGFAEDYRAQKWCSQNLPGLVTLGLQNRAAFQNYVLGKTFSRTISMLSYYLRLNTLQGSRKNIHAHYDLGNSFYKLWLDPTMTYSSALFHNETDTLEQAQLNKYDRIIDTLEAQSGSILEIGCGWGGMAERAMHKGDFDIKGITLSPAQQEFAQARLDGKANIALEDYRLQQGTFDRIVSIEMFEAVGEKYWPTYFRKIKDLLNKDGKAVIQTITINEQDFPKYRMGGDFIRTYIFPGGMLPSQSVFQREAEKAGLKIATPFYFGQNYADTLMLWLQKFDTQRQDVLNLGFDEGFIRLWRFYLAACMAGFRTGRTDVMQVEIAHAG
jgi:cyclopropane-fatty-acyl-phospholipid synthase